MLTAELIQEAADFLRGRIRRTPMERSQALSDHLGVPVYLKLESLQETGSFKVRGALFALHRARERGVGHVATCSAGNHGKGVAYAASELGMKATIFVPSSVDESKLKAMASLGADVRISEFPGYDETESWALDECESLDLPFISAYDDFEVMAGNGGTVALEVLEDVPEARRFVMPAGGGGHSAGFSFVVRDRFPDAHITLCQHEQSPAFQMSIECGRAVTELPAFQTLAGGLEGGFGTNTFNILRSRYTDVVLVSEAELRRAMRWMMAEHGHVIEGSSAVALAACFRNDFERPDAPTVIFISGRNIGEESLNNVLDEAD
jgi:threonine dehydratase